MNPRVWSVSGRCRSKSTSRVEGAAGDPPRSTGKDSLHASPSTPFKAESFELEGRLLLTAGAASTHTKLPAVWFQGTTPSLLGKNYPTETVTQDAGEATLTLERSNTAGSLRVEVTDVGSRSWE